MPEFVHNHEIVIVFLLCVAVSVLVFEWEKWQDRRALREGIRDSSRVWQCVAFYGGGSVWTPSPMTRTEAIDWMRPLGAVSYVDEERGKIFYKTRVAS